MRPTIFHENWWLDIVAPGAWKEIRCERGGQMAGHLRFMETREKGFSICCLPPLTRVLGPVVFTSAVKRESRTRRIHEITAELLGTLNPYDHIAFVLDPAVDDLLPYQSAGFRTDLHHTFQLACDCTEAELWAQLKDKTRNTIRRAQERLTVIETADALEFVRFYRTNLDAIVSTQNLELIPALYAEAYRRGVARIYSAVGSAGELRAQVMTVWDQTHYYYLLSSQNRRNSDSGAVSLILWHAIRHAASLGLTFDFDGIVGETGFRFLVGFGGQPAFRFVVRKSGIVYDALAEFRRLKRRIKDKSRWF